MKYILIAFIFLLAGYFFVVSQSKTNNDNIKEVGSKVTKKISEEVSKKISRDVFLGLKTDTSKTSIDLSQVLSGGPGKNGIPAIDKPKFDNINKVDIEDDIRGVFVSIDGEQKFYPYNILVWHEIVNDKIAGRDIAVTFCPLCGTAIVFDRNVDGDLLDFGVSGLLYESNLLMYDRKTESLWSQSIGQAVIGDYLGTKLNIVAMQLINFKELKQKYPDSKVLSSDTGYRRDYSLYPYGNYEESDDLIFPVSVEDNRFPAKEIMYVFSYKNQSISFPQLQLLDKNEEIFELNGQKFVATKDGGEIVIRNKNEILPGYYEMWFSWATHHQKDGVVWRF